MSELYQSALQYIADSPAYKDGGFHPQAKIAALEAIAEIERLTAALHANKCYPGFAYATVPQGGIDLGGGWERNREAEIEGSGDECWRLRRKG